MVDVKNGGLFTGFYMPKRPSAQIGVVDIEKLKTFYDA